MRWVRLGFAFGAGAQSNRRSAVRQRGAAAWCGATLPARAASVSAVSPRRLCASTSTCCTAWAYAWAWHGHMHGRMHGHVLGTAWARHGHICMGAACAHLLLEEEPRRLRLAEARRAHERRVPSPAAPLAHGAVPQQLAHDGDVPFGGGHREGCVAPLVGVVGVEPVGDEPRHLCLVLVEDGRHEYGAAVLIGAVERRAGLVQSPHELEVSGEGGSVQRRLALLRVRRRVCAVAQQPVEHLGCMHMHMHMHTYAHNHSSGRSARELVPGRVHASACANYAPPRLRCAQTPRARCYRGARRS